MGFKEDCQTLLDEYVSHYRAGNAAGCASVYAPDAEMYSPFGPPAIGRASIETMHHEWLQEDAQTKQIQVSSAKHSGDLGWCLARFSEAGAEHGTTLSVLARQPDGRWLITHSSLNEL